MKGLFPVTAYVQVCGGCQGNSCGYGILATKGTLWCLLRISCVCGDLQLAVYVDTILMHWNTSKFVLYDCMLIRVIQLLSHACMTKHILYMNACRYILNDMCPPLWLWLPSSSTKIYIYNYTCTLQYIEYYRTSIEYSGVRANIGRRHTSMACCLSYWSQHFIRSYYNNWIN